MPKFSVVIGMLLFALGLWGCQQKQELTPSESFNKIYNETSFTDFRAIDLVQLPDSSYIILGSSNNSFIANNAEQPYLMKVTKLGQVVWQTNQITSFGAYTRPRQGLQYQNGMVYFFANEKSSQRAVMLQYNENTQQLATRLTFDGFKGDIASVHPTKIGGFLLTFLRLQDCQDSRNVLSMIATQIDANKQISWTACYNSDREISNDNILRSINPNIFFSGEFAQGGQDTYFFNNLTAEGSKVFFLNSQTGALRGSASFPFVVNSMQYQTNNSFCMTYVKQKDLYVVPSQSFATNQIVENPMVLGNNFHEINTEERIILLNFTRQNKNYSIFATSLENIPIRLYVFETATNTLKGTLTLGRINTFYIGGVILTNDGGLAIACSTNTADRFTRIALIKVSATELNKIL